MAIQTINLGTQPSGAGGDTNRSANVKTNENFTNPLHAASRSVGLGIGDVVQPGDAFMASFGRDTDEYATGSNPAKYPDVNNLPPGTRVLYTYIKDVSINFPENYGLWYFKTESNYRAANGRFQTAINYSSVPDVRIRTASGNNTYGAWAKLYHTANTIKDANGFLKAASPVAQLYADKIDPNAEAAEQNPIFEKLGAGHYLIKGTQGFAVEGWWIEVPVDTNGNKICAVQYQTLENGDLEIKTFKKKLNEEGDIVPNLDAPIDIPNNANGEPRWIDIRLNSLPPKPIIEQVPRTVKQPKMVKQIKYSMQPTFMTKLTDLIDDNGQLVMVNGKAFQKQETYMVTDSQGMVTLTNQPVINEQGETVFEFVQMVDAEGQPVFEDVPMLDADGNQIFDEVIHEPEQ